MGSNSTPDVPMARDGSTAVGCTKEMQTKDKNTSNAASLTISTLSGKNSRYLLAGDIDTVRSVPCSTYAILVVVQFIVHNKRPCVTLNIHILVAPLPDLTVWNFAAAGVDPQTSIRLFLPIEGSCSVVGTGSHGFWKAKVKTGDCSRNPTQVFRHCKIIRICA